MAPINLTEIDTVIIGGGPSSLILSYLLHGHIPYYKGGHRDQLLDSKLINLPDLLHIHPEVYSHFGDSIRYSHQALPINALLDTLVRPNADTEINPPSCVEWRHEPTRAVPHLILTKSSGPGGQWTQLSGTPSDDIGTLSYAEMLSLPGYSFAEYYNSIYGKSPPDLMRPSRTLVASYYAAYPEEAGVSAVIRNNTSVSQISRTSTGFLIRPANIKCKHLVLASGIFTHEISIPPLLLPIKKAIFPKQPLLVIGSGFSAADAILAASSHRRIVHLFKWDPQERPSPLKGCHQQAYPEYAGVYRQMKLSAAKHASAAARNPQFYRRGSSFFNQRDWAAVYEGFPNAQIEGVHAESDGFKVTFAMSGGTRAERVVGDVEYHVGRRGSLSYLDAQLLREIVPDTEHGVTTSRSLRAKTEISSEIASNVFAIGSLTGDSLVRHAFGCCVDAASKIMATNSNFTDCNGPETEASPMRVMKSRSCPTSTTDGLSSSGSSLRSEPRAHDDLHIDRRELVIIDGLK